MTYPDHNKAEYAHLLLPKQWAQKGRIVNDGATGVEMWANRNYHGNDKGLLTYYAEEETHIGTEEELKAFWQPYKDKRNEKARERRKIYRERLNEYWELKERCEQYEKLLKIATAKAQGYGQLISKFVEQTADQTHADLIVIDTETTGLNAAEDEILQLSIIDGNGATLYNHYFKPVVATEWKGAQKVNGISPEMVSECPHIYKELPKIVPIIANAKIIVGYNTQFDLAFLGAAGIYSSANCDIIDIMRDFAPIYDEWSDKYGSYKWQKLITCADYYGYDWGEDSAHDSLADCRATLYCYECIYNKGATKK